MTARSFLPAVRRMACAPADYGEGGKEPEREYFLYG